MDVTARYFRAGADKVSIGGDAVFAAERFLADGTKTGKSSIELISKLVYACHTILTTSSAYIPSMCDCLCFCSHYGAQAVVVSIDPKRVYCEQPAPENGGDSNSLHAKTIVPLRDGDEGPKGERYCWWQTTVKGGREARDVDAVQLAKVCMYVCVYAIGDIDRYVFQHSGNRFRRSWERERSC